jgi:hypothetical protein
VFDTTWGPLFQKPISMAFHGHIGQQATQKVFKYFDYWPTIGFSGVLYKILKNEAAPLPVVG